jgi:hypothetical protein
MLLTSVLCAAACSRGGDARGDRRFVVLGDAVVRDARSALEWTRHDDGVGLEWPKADAYCRALSIDDGRWRLPSIEELRSLYGAAPGVSCGDVTCAVDPAFTLGGPYVWSATEPVPETRTYLDMQYGTALSPRITPTLVRRVLCVRTASR